MPLPTSSALAISVPLASLGVFFSAGLFQNLLEFDTPCVRLLGAAVQLLVTANPKPPFLISPFIGRTTFYTPQCMLEVFVIALHAAIRVDLPGQGGGGGQEQSGKPATSPVPGEWPKTVTMQQFSEKGPAQLAPEPNSAGDGADNLLRVGMHGGPWRCSHGERRASPLVRTIAITSISDLLTTTPVPVLRVAGRHAFKEPGGSLYHHNPTATIPALPLVPRLPRS
ncbi:hypothetical protein MAPG_01417 [Magnaporthiopsis poae ATCC 64411]|uniref:Uncharacterized protein n=1 Tax=Magnaporthiopsis poae (strain ATCC 64411 / 73-15) TaxID=644358 RepID=A0A0C4DNM5_MAGP6|nr:hypothetical protein MAPG_01417 [Magnaporthiopsis poae ATCC 64411]